MALTFDAVTRTFGKKTALDRLSLQVEPGTIVGLLGRNGAGKTTALRLAHGLLHSDSGSISVLGMDPVTEGEAVRTRVGLLQEESALYDWMTVEEIVRFGSGLHPRWDGELAASLVKRLELEPNAKVKTLSRGTRAKVALVLAVAPRPELLLLDDPTAGLDPLVRREVLQGLLEGMHDEGGAVVYASHLVHDIERVADRIAILDRGRLVLHESLETMKETCRRATAVFENEPPPGLELPGSVDVSAEGRVLTVVARGVDGEIERALTGAGASRVEVEPLPLEEILVAYLRGGE
jgi:ABC-2 type transport system ATP-binding protein